MRAKLGYVAVSIFAILGLLVVSTILLARDITGTPDGETLNGTGKADKIDGLGGDDTINGGAGKDEIDGGDGVDTINAGEHNDTVEGGTGNDTINGGPGHDTLNGDTTDPNIDITGTTDDDTINGGMGKDKIYGGRGDDTLNGGTEDDKIRGGSGKDTIDGGQGNDIIIPGTGVDIYTVRLNDGNDRIIIRAGDVPEAETETIRGGSGKDKVSFRFHKRHAIPGTRRVRDPDTGGIYEIADDIENVNFEKIKKTKKGETGGDFVAFLDPYLEPTTTCGLPGTDVTLTGDGFPIDATMTLTLGEQLITEFSTDDDEQFTVSFKVPDMEPGTYMLSASCEDYDFNEGIFFSIDGECCVDDRGGLSVAALIGIGLIAGIVLGLVLSGLRKKSSPVEQ